MTDDVVVREAPVDPDEWARLTGSARWVPVGDPPPGLGSPTTTTEETP